ncbi:MAG: hypothetical protein R3F39_21265 [Myxococcota bacterium]
MGKGKRQRKSDGAPQAEQAKPVRSRAPVDADPPLDLPPPEQRKRINALISLVLAASVFIPATYYMSDDRRDERYAWRMFSAQRAEICDAKVLEQRTDPKGVSTRHDLNLGVTIHQAWVSGLKLGRPDIVARFFEYRCEQADVQEVVLTRDCRSGAGRPLPVDVLTHECPGKAGAQAAATPAAPGDTPQ